MTQQPPPGYSPSPPAQGIGFAPAASTPSAALPPESYTSWITRVLAAIIDYIPVLIIVGIGVAVLGGTRETACITDTSEYNLGEFCATGASTIGQLSALVIAPLFALAYGIWNYGYRQGTTGSTFGKGLLEFKVVSEKTGQPIGFVLSILRQLAHIVDGAICYAGYLFPLWDAKRQTLADKIMSTVCVPF